MLRLQFDSPFHHAETALQRLPYGPSEGVRNVIVLGHIAASLIGSRITGTGVEDIAVVALEAAVTGQARSAEKLAEEVHGVLLNTRQLRW